MICSFIGINNVKNDGTEKFGNHIIPIQNNDLDENGDFTVSTSIDSFAPGTVQVVHAEIEDVHGNETLITTFHSMGGNDQAFSHLPVLQFNRSVSENPNQIDTTIQSTKSVLLYNYSNPVEGYSISAPNNKDIFAILIDNVTGQALGNEVQISSEFGLDHVKNIQATEDGGFTIIYYTKKVLKLSIKRGGTTINNFHSIKGKSGSYQKEFRAYDRKDQKCKNKLCSGTIVKLNISNRSTYMCNICQK